jgi:hypothetical protein
MMWLLANQNTWFGVQILPHSMHKKQKQCLSFSPSFWSYFLLSCISCFELKLVGQWQKEKLKVLVNMIKRILIVCFRYFVILIIWYAHFCFESTSHCSLPIAQGDKFWGNSLKMANGKEFQDLWGQFYLVHSVATLCRKAMSGKWKWNLLCIAIMLPLGCCTGKPVLMWFILFARFYITGYILCYVLFFI